VIKNELLQNREELTVNGKRQRTPGKREEVRIVDIP